MNQYVKNEAFEVYKIKAYSDNKIIIDDKPYKYYEKGQVYKYKVHVICNDCKKECIIDKQNLNGQMKIYFHKNKDFVYRCKHCAIVKFNSGSLNANWIGGRRKTTQGYIIINKLQISDSDKQYIDLSESRKVIPEHRLVMALSLKRKLDRSEIVHHINGDKTDNRIENLELFSAKQHSAITYMESVWENKIKDLEEEIVKLKEQLFELVPD